MVSSAVLGFPRIGAFRELKKNTEAYWAGKIDADQLLKIGKDIREKNWKLQKDAGVDIIPSNDFSFYDQVLDLSILFNVIPDRYTKYDLSTLDTFFAMARGLQRKATDSTKAVDVPALEMVKWFDANYHYVRPTFSNSTEFKLNGQKPVDEYLEAKSLGIETRPVLVGPISYLFLGKADKDSLDLEPISLLEKILPLYIEILKKLSAAGAQVVQIDEPVLVLDLPENVKSAFQIAYEKIASSEGLPKLILTTYFGDVRPNLDAIKNLPVSGFHFDFVRTPEQFDDVVSILGDKTLSVGIVDGRNIWKNNYSNSIEFVNKAIEKVGSDKIIVATSSSLLHTPVDLVNEKKLDSEIKNWFSFATQKVDEVVTIAKAVSGVDVSSQLSENAAAIKSRKESKITNNPEVRKRTAEAIADESMAKRHSDFPTRLVSQKAKYNLPLFPTTTIGSFPQTKEIRINRNKFTKGEITPEEYETFINSEMERVVKFQEEIGLDVLVHGEPERNDMVQYFGEKLNGFAFTQNGWVQSYGSRYVRPPILVGDVDRPAAMTVKESVYAQSLTEKPMKGMLTGPVTILRWSFPRDDVTQKVQSYQLSLALRDEVQDLEKAGITVIQVDEPAIREGLPLRAGEERSDYLKWAAESFRIATSGVEDSTQIHSHFCYSDLDPNHIKALDADVVSIEFSKKDDPNYIQEFSNYPNHIGLGLFDIHSPRIPSKEEFIARIGEILKVYPADKFWVNPDCGLKTRGWEETRASLTNMVDAAKFYREKYAN
ncbi:methionine-synthesizing 5- methyltetrahydropteroyltriglutamate--homocysteine methyltransferase [Pichia californica]|uniref:5-methyltetrahydropteroyltriglutamate--homocysteine S-methyltransferase n=1 Tax=Pichia californica TaxID=460514 RepID=A0A9P6WKL3_9ASCO|nr:methionine-synthesizing 5- methyltetrahydropteroyltriglutamate--homocysteine methyltransferase [[Candida] californica]KAG0687458.1 methionine-synthesizing 5- methyltetrahydropteroyltriglutamate--homocysteine methyltransferase [[Candida] californica]